MALFLVLSLCIIIPKLQIFVEIFWHICRAQYGVAMLVYLRGTVHEHCGGTCTPTWPPENSVHIWRLHWLLGH